MACMQVTLKWKAEGDVQDALQGRHDVAAKLMLLPWLVAYQIDT